MHGAAFDQRAAPKLAHEETPLGDRFEQAFEQAAAVGAAVRGFDHPLGVRHQPEHIARVVEDPGDVRAEPLNSSR